MSGGGSQPTSQTVTQTTIPEYLRPQVESMIGKAAGLMEGQLDVGFQPYEGQRIAGFSPMQAQAFQQVAGQQIPGQITDASNLALGAGQAAMGYGDVGTQYGAQGAAMGQKAAEIGAQGIGIGQAGQAAAQAAAQQAASGAQQYGAQGAAFGSQATGLVPTALSYGSTGQAYGQQGAISAQQAQQLAERQADIYGQQGSEAGLRGETIGARGVSAAEQGFGAQRAYQQMATSPEAIQAYMSPYMQAVVEKQQRDAIRQADIQRQANQARAVGQGAFGGSRSAIVEAELQKNLAEQLGNIQATGAQQAFQQAQQAQQYGAGLGIQGLQAGLQGLQTGMQGTGQAITGAGLGLQGTGQRLAAGQLGLAGTAQGIQGAQAGLQGVGQAGQMYGLGIQGAQAGLQGVGQQIAAGQLGLAGTEAALRGVGLGVQGAQAGIQGAQAGIQGAGLGIQGAQAATGAAGALGSLGGQQFQQQMAITDAMQKYGALQQAQQQQALDVDYQNYLASQNFPYQQLGFFSDVIRGLPVSQSTQTMYGGQPSAAAQIPGLLMAGAGYFGGRGAAEGGRIQKYAGGGSVAQEALTLEDARALPSKLRRLSDTQLAAYARTVKDAVTLSSIQSEVQRRAQARQPYNPNATLQPTMADQVVKRAEAASIGGTGMAGGGIVALQEGGTPLTEEQRAALRMAGIPESVATADRSLGGFFRNLWQGVTANPAAAGEEMEKAKATAPRLDPNVSSPHDAGQMDMVVTPPPARAETPPPQEKTGITGAGQQNVPPAAPPQERAGIMQASRAAAGPMSYEEWQKQAAPKGFSEEDQAVLNDMRSKIAQKAERAGKQSDRAIYDSIMMAGLAMMGGNSLADGLMKAAQMGGATFMTSKDKAAKAMEAAEEADLAFNKYKLELSKGNKKEARESFDDYMKYVVDLKKMDTQRDVATIQASARGGAGGAKPMTFAQSQAALNANKDYVNAVAEAKKAQESLAALSGAGDSPYKKRVADAAKAAQDKVTAIRNNYFQSQPPEIQAIAQQVYGMGNPGGAAPATGATIRYDAQGNKIQ